MPDCEKTDCSAECKAEFEKTGVCAEAKECTEEKCCDGAKGCQKEGLATEYQTITTE